MLGAIFGDIVGSVYEFNNTNNYNFPLLSDRSRLTDDSLMTLAVAKALMKTWSQPDDAIRAALVREMRDFGRRYPNGGYGGRFRQWLVSDDPQPYGSFGNGSAMRVSPAGWLYGTMEETLHAAKLTAEVTHNHPEGIKGAQAIAAGICLARSGQDKDAIQEYITGNFGYDLTRTLDEIRPTYGFYEICQKSVPEAIRAFYEGTDYEDVIRKAVALGGDSDTIACMAGALAEAYYGMPEAFRKEALNRMDAFQRSVAQDFHAFCGGHKMMMTIKQKSDIPTQANPCRTLERAIQTWQLLGDRADPGIVLAHAAQAIQWNQPVLVPVCPPEEMLEQLNADTVKVGDTLENSGSMSLRVNMLNGEAPDACQFPVFTSREAMENGPAVSSMELPLQTVVKMVLDGDNCEGIILNPFGPALFLPGQMLEPLSYVRPSSRIYLMEADITKVGADAIVNAANRTLLGGGGVDGAIHRAAGPELLAECRGLHGCSTGEAKVTGAYRLNADCIVHTVGPIYSGSREDAKLLEQCYKNSMDAAWECNCQTVAFPSISTGAYGYPIDKAAKIALRTVRNWLWEHPDSFMDVYFCCFSKADLMEYQNALIQLPDVRPDVRWTNKGVDASEKEDYKTAVRYFKRAAARGDSVALSNLGICYNLGHGITRDREEARKCWVKAAVQGDVVSICQLGDFWITESLENRTDLSKAIEEAWVFYRTAYDLCQAGINREDYPNVCLRYLRYGEGRLSRRELAHLAGEAVAGFQKRLEEGDPFAEKALEEAKEYCRRYCET